MSTTSPILLDFKKATATAKDVPVSIKTFDSYSFDRNIMVPASPFRFTAPGVDKDLRLSIRSADTVGLYVLDEDSNPQQIGTGFIDETDTHVTATRVEYVLSGRDTIGQLIDNSAVDADSKIVNTTNISLSNLVAALIANTRIPPGFYLPQAPNGRMLFQTNPGETKISCLQRYLDFMNCLVWSLPNGQLAVGRPNFAQSPYPTTLTLNLNGFNNNVIEARVRRNVNQAIRQIVFQLQSLGQVDASSFTKVNNEQDVVAVSIDSQGNKTHVGRSVYNRFSYGQGNDLVNQVEQVGNQSGNPQAIGDNMALRELAKENMKVLDVEIVMQGHLNPDGVPFNIDQIYNVQIEDENVDEPMYVYALTYDLTLQHGAMTHMRLCRLGTIVAYTDQLPRRS